MLKELTVSMPDDITSEWLDKVFYQFNNLAAKKITALKDKDLLQRVLKYLNSLSLEYLTSALKKEAVHTFYPSEIYRSLNLCSSNMFRYVGTLPIFRNYLKLGLDTHQKAFLGDVRDFLMASQRQDLIAMPFFRMDIWQKHYELGSLNEGSVSDFYFGCVSHFDHFASKVQRGFVALNFVDPIFNEIRKLLNNDFLTIDEIIKHVGHLTRSPQEVVDRLMMLVMGDQIRYTLQKPHKAESDPKIKPSKLRFCSPDNQAMFSDIRRFVNEGGVVIEPVSGLLIPVDRKMSMVISASTKVHDSMVPQYCTTEVSESLQDPWDRNTIQKEFKSLLLFLNSIILENSLNLG